VRGPRLLLGALLSVAGLALFVLVEGLSFTGPQLPATAPGYVAWLLVLVGLGLLRAGAAP